MLSFSKIWTMLEVIETEPEICKRYDQSLIIFYLKKSQIYQLITYLQFQSKLPKSYVFSFDTITFKIFDFNTILRTCIYLNPYF